MKEIRRRIKLVASLIALQMMLSACTSMNLSNERLMGASHRVKESPHCTGSLGATETQQSRQHELTPDAAPSVLIGDFKQPGPLVFIGSFPPNTKFPAHYHGADEELIVLSGSTYIGGMDGRPMDVSAGTLFRKGDKHELPVNMIHWLITTETSVVFKICTEGPFKMTFVDQKP